jgi:hypothetical protein
VAKYISRYMGRRYAKPSVRKDLLEEFYAWCGERSINYCIEKAMSGTGATITTPALSEELKTDIRVVYNTLLFAWRSTRNPTYQSAINAFRRIVEGFGINFEEVLRSGESGEVYWES